MYAWVPPVRSRGDISPITPIQPYTRIIPYLEQEHYKSKERYPASPDRITRTVQNPVANNPENSYVIYNKNKQKTRLISHQGWFMQVYG
jgi:hypothetical protein